MRVVEPRGAERSRSVRAVRAAATACECFTLWVRGKRPLENEANTFLW
jgi:hypothetical protein